VTNIDPKRRKLKKLISQCGKIRKKTKETACKVANEGKSQCLNKEREVKGKVLLFCGLKWLH
jgi:hypothetical protein